jgi:hypothetical protein
MNPVSAVGGIPTVLPTPQPTPAPAADGSGFASSLAGAVDDLRSLQATASQ